MCSGSAPAEIVVKPTRSAIKTVATRRSSRETPRRWPHSWQNRAPAAVVAPQAGQVMGATLPVAPGPPGRRDRLRASPRARSRPPNLIQIGPRTAEEIEDKMLGKAPMDRTQPRGRVGTATDDLRAPAAGDLEVVLDALPQPAFVVSIDDDEVCRFVHANGRYRELFGIDPDGYLG